MDKTRSKEDYMKIIIEHELTPIATDLFEKIKKEGLALKLDGIDAYNPNAQFVGGTVIYAASYIALEMIKTKEALEDLSGIIRMAAGMEMRTWGIAKSLQGLCLLHAKGLLEKVVDEETLNGMRASLDWRTFVDTDNGYQLKNNLATNYYGVAFNIALCRHILGWEQKEYSMHILNLLLEHIDCYSGEMNFMDETKGEGRFDRYSVLVPAELYSSILNAGIEAPAKIRAMLDRSAHLMLQLANEDGRGISYGRSVGTHGDAAVLEVLGAAAKMGGILTEEELEIAYAYCMRVMKRLIGFWYDKEMQAFNLWDHGRKTDNYRNKNRILSETLGIILKIVNAYQNWKNAGFGDGQAADDRKEQHGKQFEKQLEKQEPYAYIPFAEGEYQRGLAIIRDKKYVWTLPLINGGHHYYDRDAYMPVPYQAHVLQSVPEYNHCQLVPQLIMEDGQVYMPLAYTSEIVPGIFEDHMTIECTYDSLCRMGSGVFISGESKAPGSHGYPQKVEGISAKVRYTFTPGCIRREDCFTVTSDAEVKEVRLVLLTYSEEPKVQGNEVVFKKGILTKMCAEGYDACEVKAATDDGSYDTPEGRLNHEVVWKHRITRPSKTLRYGWTIKYGEPGV